MPMELPEWHQDLLDEAKLHLARTSCTKYNEETKEYERSSVCKSGPKEIGQVTNSVGVQLYFHFIKRMGVVFLVMFILSTPGLVFNIFGKMSDAPSAMNKYLAMLAVGNIGQCPAHGCRTTEELRERCLMKESCADGAFWPLAKIEDLQVKDVTQWLGLLDGIAILFFMLWAMHFKERVVPRKSKEHDLSVVTPADYTLQVIGLPKKLENDADHFRYEDLLKEHFVNVLKEAQDPVDDAEAIDKVTLVRNYGGAVASFQTHGTVLIELDNDKKLLEIAQDEQTKADEKKAPKAEQRVKKREKAIEDREAEAKKYEIAKFITTQETEREVVKAFVTFKKIHYKEVVEQEYSYGNYRLYRLCQAQKYRFQNSKLRVKQAPEPSDLFWENLDFPQWKRLLRKMVVMLITFILLILCIVALVYIKANSELETSNEFDTWLIEPAEQPDACFKVCQWNLYSKVTCNQFSLIGEDVDKFHGVNGDWQTGRDGVWNDTAMARATCIPKYESPACSNAGATNNFLAIDFGQDKDVKCMSLVQDKDTAASKVVVFGCNRSFAFPNGFGANFSAADKCIRMQQQEASNKLTLATDQGVSSGSLHVVKDTSCSMDKASLLKYEEAIWARDRDDTGVSSCYCLQRVLEEPSLLSPAYDTNDPVRKFCSDWIEEQAKVYGMLGLGVVAVVIINFLLKIIFSILTSFKRLETMTENTRSQLSLLFVAQFINTGLLITLVNWNIKGIPEPFNKVLVQWLQIGEGSYYQPDGIWIIAVGAGLCITIFTQVLSSVATPIVMGKVVSPLLMWKAKRSGKRVTLDTLQQVYVYPDFDLGQRLAESLNVIACILCYSGCMPVLYVIGMIYCLISYWIDKNILLTASKMPPAYDGDIISRSLTWAPFFAFLHVFFALIFFSNPDIYPSDFSMLRQFAEIIVSMDSETYNEFVVEWETLSSGDKDAQYGNFLKTRFIDFSRKSVWLLMILFLVGVVFFIIMLLYRYLLKPFLDPFLFAIKKKWCTCLHTSGEDDHEEDYRTSKETMKSKGLPTGYSMAESTDQKYQKAAKAMDHHKTLSQSMSSINPDDVPKEEPKVEQPVAEQV